MEVLHLIDASGWIYRSYFGQGERKNSDGRHCGAVYGIALMLTRLFLDHHPRRIAAVFDSGGKNPRRDLLPTYKTGRKEKDVELATQFPLIRALIRAFGVPIVESRDCEADDMLAALARAAQERNLPVVIETSDKDMMQLVRDGRVLVYDTMAHAGAGEIYGETQVREKFGVAPAQLADWLALRGDPVDKIPGLRKCGEVAATAIMREFGSVDNFLDHRTSVEKRLKGKLRGAASLQKRLMERAVIDELMLSRTLVEFWPATDVPDLDDLIRSKPDVPTLRSLFMELEFISLLPMVGGAIASP
jgi:DNA polymerase-1